ncbi:hypothetical protein [Streptomyces sp. NPDC048248]|uniref:hypothetical protein n=1 Tax=Streptomyces sp. NPDC048248 TaxID=3365523 RepID=UPI003718B0C1
MGIESDQLVFDYLSRVGDLAQQRGLPSAARMRLVATLRAEIDAQKADSVPGVRRILSRLGTPEAVVAAAGSGEGPAVGSPRAPEDDASAGPAVPLLPDAPDSSGAPESSPGTRPSRPAGRPLSTPRQKLSGLAWRSGLSGLTGKVPAPREGSGSGFAPSSGFGFLKKPGRPERPPLPDLGQTASPPHLASAAELGDTTGGPDWWRVEASPFGPGETVPGFVGGIEIPEIWERPPGEDPLSLKKAGTDDGAAPDAEATAGGAGALPGMLRKALGRRRGAAAADQPEAETADETAAPEVVARAPLSPVLSLAVLLLAAGALLGSWLALAGGWGLAYVSRRLSRTEAKFAALGVPGVVAGGLMVWLWGRFDGRWGDPIAQGRLGQELADGLPAVARVAAVASALFLVWRMRRTPR